ncbi:coiled-coil domain-containing protein [Plantactinospora siamensis]|uniref:Coiled-coil domain-containing protein n=1 Tax=Plantactinospora siamensis TaxID=555372 RepID=A0ABV6NWG6_9ACTN
MRATPVVRHLLLALVLALLAGPVAVAAPTPALAAPGADDEGGTKKLRDALDAAARGYLDAQHRLDASTKRQAQLAAELREVETRLGTLTAEAGVVAARSYRMGRLGPVMALLNSGSAEDLLDRAAELELMAQRDDRSLGALAEARIEAARAKQAIDDEVSEQRRQVAVMAKKKQDAERALATVGGRSSGGFVSTSSALAKPAPRNSDGSWPSESCSVDDPTTSGCITPRTLHAYQQARAAGFTRYTSCHRNGGEGEHPKGRACDFSAAAGGFEDRSATGGDRAYGDRLAAYFIKNAGRLGVLYVIWYRQIWLPGTGWKSYSGGGSPAADHTNHVHLSMY